MTKSNQSQILTEDTFVHKEILAELKSFQGTFKFLFFLRHSTAKIICPLLNYYQNIVLLCFLFEKKVNEVIVFFLFLLIGPPNLLNNFLMLQQSWDGKRIEPRNIFTKFTLSLWK